jgi:hypothetical protein
MATPPRHATTVDISAAPRAVIGTAAELFYWVGRSVFGDERMPTAKDNAWAAVCEDRERARQRDETQQWFALANLDGQSST